MTYRIDIDIHGPATDPERFDAAARAYLQRTVDQVTREARNNVLGHLITFIRKPTPFYWTQVVTERQRPFQSRVWDQRVVHGPWLEGVSERNRSTRFKGYAAFRVQTQRTAGKVPEIVAPLTRDFVQEMDG